MSDWEAQIRVVYSLNQHCKEKTTSIINAELRDSRDPTLPGDSTNPPCTNIASPARLDKLCQCRLQHHIQHLWIKWVLLSHQFTRSLHNKYRSIVRLKVFPPIVLYLCLCIILKPVSVITYFWSVFGMACICIFLLCLDVSVLFFVWNLGNFLSRTDLFTSR